MFIFFNITRSIESVFAEGRPGDKTSMGATKPQQNQQKARERQSLDKRRSEQGLVG